MSTNDTTKPGAPRGTHGGGNGNAVPWQNLFWVAVAIAAAYVVFAALGWARAGEGDQGTAWERSLYVLKGVEAIAFTAIGWLFGREVNRGGAEAAKVRADAAQKDADQAKADASIERTRTEAARDRERDAHERATKAEKAGVQLPEAVRARLGAEVAGRETGGDEQAPVGGARGRAREVPPASGDPDTAYLRGLADRLFPGG